MFISISLFRVFHFVLFVSSIDYNSGTVAAFSSEIETIRSASQAFQNLLHTRSCLVGVQKMNEIHLSRHLRYCSIQSLKDDSYNGNVLPKISHGVENVGYVFREVTDGVETWQDVLQAAVANEIGGFDVGDQGG
jgi:hypothetical protein